MTVEQYLTLMHFPAEWQAYGMLPSSEFIEKYIASYSPGMEQASEHDRNGFFQYWLRRDLDQERLDKIIKLAELDPDPGLRQDILGSISKLKGRAHDR